MRKFLLFCGLTIAALTNVQAQLSYKIDSIGFLPETICLVSKVAEAYLLVPQNEMSTQRYAPKNLSAEYQREGALVRVTGVIGAIPPNVRMIGTPFQIRSIELAEPVTGGIKPSRTDATGGVAHGADPATDKGKVTNNANTIDYRIPLKEQGGIVRKMTGDQFVIEVGSTRYLPDQLPDNLRVDGMRVRFSGKAGQLPPNARLLGTPLQISKIMKDKGKLVKKGKSANGNKVTKKEK
ncbi:MAG: hypothetical protein IPL33_00535 [Sphingobacteriales bacterium]|nr:hypothetical protein [Sphingobacteriales bacterium]